MPFGNSLYHEETSQLSYKTNRLTGFLSGSIVFAEMYFWSDSSAFTFESWHWLACFYEYSYVFDYTQDCI